MVLTKPDNHYAWCQETWASVRGEKVTRISTNFFSTLKQFVFFVFFYNVLILLPINVIFLYEYNWYLVGTVDIDGLVLEYQDPIQETI